MSFLTAALPFVAQGVGSLLGGLGSSGKQAEQKSTQTQTGTNTSDVWNRAVEPEYWTNFRKGLMGSYASALNDASKPVYDNSAIASALGKYSSLYDGGVKNLRSIAAKSGRLNSGFFDSSLADLTNQKLSGQAGFLTSLPALERQAKMQNLQSLLGLGASWSGSAPVDTHQSGTTTSNLTSNSSTSMYGPGLMQNFASLLGGGLLNGNFDNLFSKRSGPQVI